MRNAGSFGVRRFFWGESFFISHRDTEGTESFYRIYKYYKSYGIGEGMTLVTIYESDSARH